MLSFKKTGILVGLIGMAVSMTGCTKHETDYLRQAQTVPPLSMPPGVSVQGVQTYYSVPVNGVSSTTPPSQLPPDSNLQRFKRQQQAIAKTAENATVTTAAVRTPTLMVAGNTNQAWDRVGRALHQTAYQVLDQDPSMNSYYVLDTADTHNQLTKATPIYRVYLKAADGKTAITLLNQNNEPANTAVADRILTAIQQKLA